jgi:tRNA threonylcarbamoyl adenosine modification protein (Sua5/YciO/YrdC/YwlC family)
MQSPLDLDGVPWHVARRLAMLLRIDALRPAPRALRPAIDALRDHEVIIYPTDTGYAFGCMLSSARGIERLRRLKGIPEKHPKPLTMLVKDLAEVAKYGKVDNHTFRVIRRLLPGPYTLVLNATHDVPRGMKNRLHEVGLRVPDHPVCRMLCELLEQPLLTGSVTPADEEFHMEDPEELERRYALDVRVVIDAGPLTPNPSTVLRLVDDQLEVIREGQGPVPT